MAHEHPGEFARFVRAPVVMEERRDDAQGVGVSPADRERAVPWACYAACPRYSILACYARSRRERREISVAPTRETFRPVPLDVGPLRRAAPPYPWLVPRS
jgi:hypothetical protein